MINIIGFDTNPYTFYGGESVTVQAGKVSASAWMDRKMVMMMSTKCQPLSCATVSRKQWDETSLEVPCPETTILLYNKFMGGVDHGDQLRGYYRCRSRSRKFYKHIFFFLLDVAITNAYIPMKSSGRPWISNPFNYSSQRSSLAGEYCVCHCWGRGGDVFHPLPFCHFPIRLDANDEPQRPQGPCAFHHDIHDHQVLSTCTRFRNFFSKCTRKYLEPHCRNVQNKVPVYAPS